MNNKKNLVPLFCSGDVGGMAYLITNNIVNYLIVIATLTGLGWDNNLIFKQVIPGMSMGLLCSGFYYAYMGYKLSKREGRADVTALPSGVSTPAMFVILYGVITPLHYALGDSYLAWYAAVAACFIGGLIEFLGGFVGPWMKKRIPRAALLGTVAGIGFIWMSTQGVFDIFGDPMVGLPIMFVALTGVIGGYLFPKKIPPMVVAIVGGIIYAFALGRTSFDFSGIGFYVPDAVSGVQALINGFAIVLPYLSIIIPIEIYNFIETMDNVEAANAAGDDYSVREAQFADGICTMIAACFGGVVPNTVWLGHAGLKKTKAGIGYSWVSGLVLGLCGIFGLFTLLSSMVPAAVCAITFLWCATVMVAQAFKDCDVKHYAAVAVAMVPPVADYLYTQVEGALATGMALVADPYDVIWTTAQDNGLMGYSEEITQNLIYSGVMWNGVPAVKSGAIIIGIILGAMTVYIIDKQLDKVAIVSVVAAGLSMTGFIHSAALGLYITSPFAIGYLMTAVIAYVLHLGRDKWFDAPDDFSCV